MAVLPEIVPSDSRNTYRIHLLPDWPLRTGIPHEPPRMLSISEDTAQQEMVRRADRGTGHHQVYRALDFVSPIWYDAPDKMDEYV